MPRTLTEAQRRRIEQAIRDGHLAFFAELFGPSALTAEDYARLKKAGKIRPEKEMEEDVATAGAALGSMIAKTSADDAGKLSPEKFWEMMHERPDDLDEVQYETLALLRDRIGQHIRHLGDKMVSSAGHIMIEEDDKVRRRKLSAVKREVPRGVAAGADPKAIAQRLRDSTRDLKRDWLRIAQTEAHNLVEESKAVVIASEHYGTDPLVFKRPRHTACPFCVLLYLKPDGVTPRVFRLSELMANGSNVGRKANRPLLTGKRATEWKATLGSVHPFCECQLFHLGEGMGFNTKGELVYVGKTRRVVVERIDKALADHDCVK